MLLFYRNMLYQRLSKRHIRLHYKHYCLGRWSGTFLQVYRAANRNETAPVNEDYGSPQLPIGQRRLPNVSENSAVIRAFGIIDFQILLLILMLQNRLILLSYVREQIRTQR